MNPPERHRIGRGVIEVPEVLNRGEKAANHVCDERRLYAHAQPVHLPLALRAHTHGLTFDPAERAQWGEDQDQIGDQSHYSQLGGDLQVGVVSQIFVDRVDVEVGHTDVDDREIDG